jgi:hypothetical protein
MQEHTSAKTSVNMVPTLFKRVPEFGKKNLDIGGGKFDTASEWLLENHNCKNFVYDPFNRTPEHNHKVFQATKNGVDTITLSNVLNVIKEKEYRDNVLSLAAARCADGAKVYITVYEGDRSGKSRTTRCGFQLNRKTEAYMKEVGKFFESVERKGKLIIASGPVD